MGFPSGSDGKESACNVGDLGWEDPGERNGYALQDSCLKNSMDREPGGLHTVHGVTKSQTRLSDFHFHTFFSQGIVRFSLSNMCWS